MGRGYSRKWGERQRKRQRSYEEAWTKSVPAESAPVGIAPSQTILRAIHDRYPMVQVRWDWRPHRRCFVLWEYTQAGDWVVIQDVPRGTSLDQRIIDHLTVCDMAAHGGQGIIDAVDAMAARVARDRKSESRRKAGTDWDRVLWAAQKDARDTFSTPFNVRTAVPAQIEGAA